MIIPMEILSLITRADSGSSPRQREPFGGDNGNRFEQVFQDAQAGKDSSVSKGVKPSAKTTEDRAIAENPDERLEGEAHEAGVMGIQGNVVFILEGDMISVTTPEICPEICTEAPVIQMAAADAEVPQEVPLSVTGEDDQAQSGRISEDDTKFADFAAPAKDTGAETKAKSAEAESMISADNDDPTGEAAARKPVEVTSEQQGNNKEQDSGFSENGAPSHLENENDPIPTNIRKETSNQETQPVVQHTTDETANNITPPLAEGIAPERFQAEQQMQQTAHAPVTTDNLLDEMISRIEMAQTESQQTMTIQLKPEFLGKVALEIAMDAAGLHVKIAAADPSVRGMINGQINALIESLENKGIEVVEVEVAYTGVNNGDLKDPRGGSHAQPGRAKRPKTIDRAESVEFGVSLMSETLEHYLDIGQSTVEYSA